MINFWFLSKKQVQKILADSEILCENNQNVQAFIVLGNVMLVTVIVMVATGILIVSVVIFQVSYFIFNNLYAMKYAMVA